MHVSPGNRKLGILPTISFAPVSSCAEGVPCAKECYAKRMMNYARGVTKSWDRNLLEWEQNPRQFEADVMEYFSSLNRPRFFRWFVGGDCPDRGFWALILRVARAFPDVRFLMFTKRYGLIKGKIPKNLQVVISAWPGWPIPARLRRRFPVAWIRDPQNVDGRIPDDAMECPGGCDHCGMCWSLSELGRDVVFKKH